MTSPLPAPPSPPPAPAAAERPYRPMAIGFWLLALPLFVAILLADDGAGRVTNAIAGAAMLLLGVVVDRIRSR